MDPDGASPSLSPARGGGTTVAASMAPPPRGGPAAPDTPGPGDPPRTHRQHRQRPMKVKRLTEDSLVARLLGGLAGAVIRHRHWFAWPQLVLFIFCIYHTKEHLEFDTSRNNLVGSNQAYHQNFLKFKKEFPTQDDLVVVVESEDAEKNRQFVERLGVKLEAETNLFRDVFYKGDLKMLGSKALLFVPGKRPERPEEDPAGLSAVHRAIHRHQQSRSRC